MAILRRFRKSVFFVVLIALAINSLASTAFATGSAGLFTRIVHPNDYWAVDIINIHEGWAGPWVETQNIEHTNIHLYYYPSGGASANSPNKIHLGNLHLSGGLYNGKFCYWAYDNQTIPFQKTNCDSPDQYTLRESIRQTVTEWADNLKQGFSNAFTSTWFYTTVTIHFIIYYVWYLLAYRLRLN